MAMVNNADDDDDISLVSRSPSPGLMNVDASEPSSISTYDAYHPGVEREVITVDTRIKSTNKGFAMLAKLGWIEGQPLGLSTEGRVDPIPFYIKNDLTGLGKTSQDFRMIETTVAQRRGLDSERQHKETEEQRKVREEIVARRTALQSEISSTLRPFYCALCDKQFKTVTQYDEHTNSYAHHHKARLKDMQANARIVPKEEVGKRKEKERKREEKELRKIAAANGVKMSKPAVTGAAATAAIIEPSASADTTASNKSSGWVSLSASSSAASQGFKQSRWSTVSGPLPPTTNPTPTPLSGAPAPPTPRPPSPPSDAPPPPPTSGWQKVSSSSEPPRPSAPAFRTGGWTTLDPATVPVSPFPPLAARSRPSSPRPDTPQNQTYIAKPAPIPAAQPMRSGWQQFKSQPKRR
ncbi:G-patch-domain Zn-finger DNA-binding protein [Amanita muscaria]